MASNIYIYSENTAIHISRNIVTRSSDETDRTMLTKRWNKILAKRLHVWFPVTPETGTPAIVIRNRSNDDPRSKERRSVHVVAIYLSRLIITSNQCLLPSPHPHPERV